jgi:hypothetical protein
VRVDGIDGPKKSLRPVAMRTKSRGDPFVQEMDDSITEMVTTKNEREANYVHQGWSLSAASTIPLWASSRIANKSQPNPNGVWITKRSVLQRLTFRVLLDELAPMPQFEADMKAALEKPTTSEKFQAVHKTLHIWLVSLKQSLTHV